MFHRLEVIEQRYEELNRMLMDPSISSSPKRLREVSKEHASIRPMVDGWRRLQALRQQVAECEELLGDPELREMAQEEKAEIGRASCRERV